MGLPSEPTYEDGLRVFAECWEMGWYEAAITWAIFCQLVVEQEGIAP